MFIKGVFNSRIENIQRHIEKIRYRDTDKLFKNYNKKIETIMKSNIIYYNDFDLKKYNDGTITTNQETMKITFEKGTNQLSNRTKSDFNKKISKIDVALGNIRIHQKYQNVGDLTDNINELKKLKDKIVALQNDPTTLQLALIDNRENRIINVFDQYSNIHGNVISKVTDKSIEKFEKEAKTAEKTQELLNTFIDSTKTFLATKVAQSALRIDKNKDYKDLSQHIKDIENIKKNNIDNLADAVHNVVEAYKEAKKQQPILEKKILKNERLEYLEAIQYYSAIRKIEDIPKFDIIYDKNAKHKLVEAFLNPFSNELNLGKLDKQALIKSLDDESRGILFQNKKYDFRNEYFYVNDLLLALEAQFNEALTPDNEVDVDMLVQQYFLLQNEMDININKASEFNNIFHSLVDAELFQGEDIESVGKLNDQIEEYTTKYELLRQRQEAILQNYLIKTDLLHNETVALLENKDKLNPTLYSGILHQQIRKNADAFDKCSTIDQITSKIKDKILELDKSKKEIEIGKKISSLLSESKEFINAEKTLGEKKTDIIDLRHFIIEGMLGKKSFEDIFAQETPELKNDISKLTDEMKEKLKPLFNTIRDTEEIKNLLKNLEKKPVVENWLPLNKSAVKERIAEKISLLLLQSSNYDTLLAKIPRDTFEIQQKLLEKTIVDGIISGKPFDEITKTFQMNIADRNTLIAVIADVRQKSEIKDLLQKLQTQLDLENLLGFDVDSTVESNNLIKDNVECLNKLITINQQCSPEVIDKKLKILKEHLEDNKIPNYLKFIEETTQELNTTNDNLSQCTDQLKYLRNEKSIKEKNKIIANKNNQITVLERKKLLADIKTREARGVNNEIVETQTALLNESVDKINRIKKFIKTENMMIGKAKLENKALEPKLEKKRTGIFAGAQKKLDERTLKNNMGKFKAEKTELKKLIEDVNEDLWEVTSKQLENLKAFIISKHIMNANLDDIKEKAERLKRPTLMNFFATNFPGGKVELPNTDQLYERFINDLVKIGIVAEQEENRNLELIQLINSGKEATKNVINKIVKPPRKETDKIVKHSIQALKDFYKGE